MEKTLTSLVSRIAKRMMGQPVRTADPEDTNAALWNEVDVYNGHHIPWGSKDPNLEMALAQRDAEQEIRDMDDRLAAWDAENVSEIPEWEFSGLVHNS